MALEEPLLFVASSGTGSIVALAHDTLRHAFSFGHEEGHGKLSMPMGVAVYRDASGKALVYVTDRDNDRLVAYDMDGGFVRAIGSRGRAPGQFMEPLGVAISGECIFVAEGLVHGYRCSRPMAPRCTCCRLPTSHGFAASPAI